MLPCVAKGAPAFQLQYYIFPSIASIHHTAWCDAKPRGAWSWTEAKANLSQPLFGGKDIEAPCITPSALCPPSPRAPAPQVASFDSEPLRVLCTKTCHRGGTQTVSPKSANLLSICALEKGEGMIIRYASPRSVTMVPWVTAPLTSLSTLPPGMGFC